MGERLERNTAIGAVPLAVIAVVKFVSVGRDKPLNIILHYHAGTALCGRFYHFLACGVIPTT